MGCAQEVSAFQRQEREISSKNIKKSLERSGFTPHSAAEHLVTLSPAAPQRELRKTKEDGINRKDGMYDVEQGSRRNKSIIINTDHSTCVRRFGEGPLSF